MSAFFAKIGSQILSYLLNWALGRLTKWLKEQAQDAKRKEVNDANLERYQKAIKENAPDAEISKIAEDLLNGFDRSAT